MMSSICASTWAVQGRRLRCAAHCHTVLASHSLAQCAAAGHWWGVGRPSRRGRRLWCPHASTRRAHAARAPPLPPLSAHPLQAQCRLRCSVFPPRARWARLVRAEAGAGGGHGRAGGVAPVPYVDTRPCVCQSCHLFCLPVHSAFFVELGSLCSLFPKLQVGSCTL